MSINPTPLPLAASGQISLVEVWNQVKGASDEMLEVMERFLTRPDWESQIAMDEMHASLRALRTKFSDCEVVLDGVIQPTPALEQRRSFVRRLRQIIDERLRDCPAPVTVVEALCLAVVVE